MCADVGRIILPAKSKTKQNKTKLCECEPPFQKKKKTTLTQHTAQLAAYGSMIDP
jgi:hypothetical protein